MARTAKRYKSNCKETKANGVESFQVGIYSRLSVDIEERKSESIENQIDMINQFIYVNNSKPDREMDLIVQDIYVDRGSSGMSFEREGFSRLMQDVKEHRINCIIVKDLSRFGRDYLETGNLIEKILPFLGCRFIAVADHFDSMAINVYENKLTMNIKNLVNDMYVKDISKRVAIAKEISAKKGAFIGSFAPYGYDVVNMEGVRKLKINEACAKVVQKIYTLYSHGISCKDIITLLYNDKVHRISDYKKYGHTYCDTGEILHQWSVGSIYGILQNTNYLGSLQPYKSEKRLHEEKDSIFYTKEDEEEAVHHTHQAIVSIKLFEKVQNRLKIKMSDKKTQYKSKNTENIYRNILYCGNCGKVMHSVYYQSRKKDERHYSYYCKRAYFIDHRKCEKNYIREEQVTSLVQKQLCNTFKEQQIEAKDFIKLNMDECDRRIAEYERKGGKIAKEFEYMKKQAAMMYGRYKEGEITKEEYLAFKQNKKEQDNYAKKSLEEMKQKIRRAKDKAEEENKFLCSLLKADKCKTLNIQLVEAFIEKISIFSNGVVDIVYTFSKGEE